MTRLRRALTPLAAIWLVCQLGAAALVPAALSAGAGQERAAGCTCGHGAHAMCPMHHHKPSGPDRTCSMQPVNTAPAAVLSALVGAAGFIAGAAALLHAGVHLFAHRPGRLGTRRNKRLGRSGSPPSPSRSPAPARVATRVN